MSRTRIAILWIAVLLTFAWLLVPEPRSSPASLWPSALAVGLAFVTRDIYLSLFLGAFSGAVLLSGGNVFSAFLELFSKHMIPALKDPWNISVLMFTLMMGGFVELLNQGGGMKALAERLVGRAGNRRNAGLAVYGLGWLVFIDGLANAMLIGKTMRPVTDRVGMSRAKLAFIVDSTSSPIAGLALVSTWVAYEMSVIRDGLIQAGLTAAAQLSPFQLLVQSLPSRFYNWFILLIVFLTIWLGRDFGPMREAETKAHPPKADDGAASADKRPSSIWLALIPIIVLVGGVFLGLFLQGGGMDAPLTLAGVIEAFGKADAALVFVWVTALASLLAMGMNKCCSHQEHGGVVATFFEGMKHMFLPTLILVFAWTLNSVIKELGAAKFIAAFLGGHLSPSLLPALVFSTAALISFSTGTSWGTMAIVMPLAIPLAVKMTGLTEGAAVAPLFVTTVGAVLAGAVFGDHCSPISDTTIVSAFSSGCEVMDHVRTQLPYAVVAAAVSVVCGYLAVGAGVPAGLGLAAGTVACWACVRWLGKKPG